MSFSVLFQRDFEVIMLLWYNIKNCKEDLAVEAEKAITINPYSLTSYYVDILFNDKKLSNATCFFTQQNEKIYLVTNWHVVSGRNADTNVVMKSNRRCTEQASRLCTQTRLQFHS